MPDNVVLGERSWLDSSFSFLHYRSRRPCGVRIGHDSGVYLGTFFELGPDGQVEIGNYCTLVGAIIATNHRVVIEDYVLIAHEVVVADSFAAAPPAADRKVLAADPLRPSVIIHRNAWVGTRAVLLGGADVGEGAIIGAGAVIDFPVPAYAVAGGNPARVVGWARPREK